MKRICFGLGVWALFMLACQEPEIDEVGAIEVSSRPAGAEVSVDDSLTDEKTDCILEEVPAGDHLLHLSLEGYVPYQESVSVSTGDTSYVDAVLDEEPFTVLEVSSHPPGADISLDGQNTGYKTDHTFQGITTGEHQIKLTLSRYLDWDTTVTIIQNDTCQVVANLVEKVGAILVSSEPQDAYVYLDDTLANYKTDCLLTGISPGEHTLRLVLENHFGWEGKVIVEIADTVEVHQVLEDILSWRYHAGDMIHTSPCVSQDGNIYFATWWGEVHSLDENGGLRWSYSTGSLVESSPTLGEEGNLYFGCHDNYLYSLTPSGDFRWRYGSSANVVTSPAVGSDGTIYVGANARLTVTQKMINYLYALRPDSVMKWRYKIGEEDDEITSSPAVAADGTVYFASNNGYFYAVNPDGTLEWRYGLSSVSFSSPAIAADGTIYFGCQDGTLYALSPQGSLRWKFTSSGAIQGSAVIASDGTVYFGSGDGNLYALDAQGSQLWKFDAEKPIKSTPAIGADGTIFFGASFNGIYAVDPEGGLRWFYETEGSIQSSSAIGQDGILYVGADDGYIYALKVKCGGLAPSAWPKFGHDNRNTARTGW